QPAHRRSKVVRRFDPSLEGLRNPHFPKKEVVCSRTMLERRAEASASPTRIVRWTDDDDRIRRMPSNRVFFPQGALARWLDEGKIELVGETLTMRDEGHRYRIVEAVLITREVTG